MISAALGILAFILSLVESSGAAHSASPSAHGPLRLQIIFVALIWTCGFLSFLLAFLGRNFRDSAFDIALYTGGVCIICGTLLSLDFSPIIFN